MPHTHEALSTVINNLYYFSDSAFPVSIGSSGKDITGTSRSTAPGFLVSVLSVNSGCQFIVYVGSIISFFCF
ncbi:hypothetical protein, partial [Escherichia coli]|uniref:hypothetical protein n=1 Tax=Escherichia coli TaxID=562 RepID=UPI0019D71214